MILLVSLAACSSTTTTASSSTQTATPQSLAPGISYFSTNFDDLDDATTSVDVDIYARALNISNINIPYSAQTLIYYLDVTPPTDKTKPATTAAGTYIQVSGIQVNEAVTWKNVLPGMHTFYAQLVNNDYTPLNPPVIAQSVISVPSNPSKTTVFQDMTVVSSPHFSTVYPGVATTTTPSMATFEISVGGTMSNFRINGGNIGNANVSGEGHYIYYMDVNPPDTPGQPATTAQGTYSITAGSSYTWSQVSIGQHTLSIQAVNNDNTPLSPAVIIKTIVTVPSEPVLLAPQS